MSDVTKIKNNLTTTSFNTILPNIANKTSNFIENISDKLIEDVELLSSETLNYSNIITDGYTPQGITSIDGQIFLTAYKNGENSRIYIYDESTNEYKGKLILNNKAHVGGITYDEENGIIFVTGTKGRVNTYSYDRIKEVIESEAISKIDDDFTIDFRGFTDEETNECYFSISSNININVNENMDSKVATVCYYDGRIFIGSFEGIDPGIWTSYEISYDKENNTINIKKPSNGFLPSATQGMAYTEYNGSKYLITAQSVGVSKSTITIFKKSNTGYETGRIYLDDIGIEGIDVNERGEIIAVFENGRDEILATNIENLEKKYDSYSVPNELMQDIMGIGYEAKSKFNEILNKLKELR